MNRKQRRKNRPSPLSRPATIADVKRAKAEATDKSLTAAWGIFFTVLRDKEGMGIDDLRRIWGHINDLSDSIAKGYCNISDLRDILKTESGVVLK